MFFAWDITISAGTAEATPKEQILKVTKGVITRVDVKFPPGCHGFVKARLLRSEFQLVPLSRGEWVTGDGETVPTEGYYELDEVPAELKFVGCSPGSTYDHVVTVRVSIIPAEIASPWETLSGLVKVLKKLIGVD
jgi:hypothetical protein